MIRKPQANIGLRFSYTITTQKQQTMKYPKLILAAVFCMAAITVSAQEIELNDVPEFHKLIIKGNATAVYLKRGSHVHPKIAVEGAEKSNVSIDVESGIATLKISIANEATVYVSNSGLKRISGNNEMKVYGADLLHGGEGKFYVLRLENKGGRWSENFENIDDEIEAAMEEIEDAIQDIDFDIDIDPDFDFDFDFGWDKDFHFDFDLDESDFDFNFDFDFDFDDETRVRVDFDSDEFSRKLNKSLQNIRVKIKEEIRDN